MGKPIKPLEYLNPGDIAQLPLWGCEYFKIRSTCLYMKIFITNNIMYVKHLINPDGNIKSDAQLMQLADDKINIIQEVYIIKNYILKQLKKV